MRREDVPRTTAGAARTSVAHAIARADPDRLQRRRDLVGRLRGGVPRAESIARRRARRRAIQRAFKPRSSFSKPTPSVRRPPPPPRPFEDPRAAPPPPRHRRLERPRDVAAVAAAIFVEDALAVALAVTVAVVV